MKEVLTIKTLVDHGALVTVNHSGGKDSQAMYNYLSGFVPEGQILLMHATLGRYEWERTITHICDHAKHELHVVKASKTIMERIRERGMFPSISQRWCTSDLKRGPLQKGIRQYCNKHGFQIVINCLGMRADESRNRAKLKTLTTNKGQTNGKRVWLDWLPIHHYDWNAVLATEGHTLEELEQRRKLWKKGKRKEALDGWKFHWIYVAGMDRCSCKFCIMASAKDLRCAAELAPDELKEYTDFEKESGFSFQIPTKTKSGKLHEITQAPEQLTLL